MKLNSTNVTIAVSLVIIVLIGLFMAFAPRSNTSSKGEELIPFAKCLADAGAKFYGAFWCQHCQNQKALFGKAAKDLPYIECSTPDMKGQTAICSTNEIMSYPTWIFADGTRQVGEISLEDLSKKTQCPLVQS
jgi:hypothetical protein